MTFMKIEKILQRFSEVWHLIWVDKMFFVHNGNTYRNMMNALFLAQALRFRLDESWFQQDGDTCQASGKINNCAEFAES